MKSNNISVTHSENLDIMETLNQQLDKKLFTLKRVVNLDYW
jgi:hypothetical protein